MPWVLSKSFVCSELAEAYSAIERPRSRYLSACSSLQQQLKLHSCEEPISGEIYLERIVCWSSWLHLEFVHERTKHFKEKRLLFCRTAARWKPPGCVCLLVGLRMGRSSGTEWSPSLCSPLVRWVPLRGQWWCCPAPELLWKLRGLGSRHFCPGAATVWLRGPLSCPVCEAVEMPRSHLETASDARVPSAIVCVCCLIREAFEKY